MATPHRRCPYRTAQTGLILLVLISICLVGCVRRRLTIRSYPEGALVYVDQQEVGHTPISTNFVHYGAREIVLEKDGFQTVKVKQNIRPPWYQIPPLDFFAENLWPWEIRDERSIEMTLAPQVQARQSELQQRAEQLRGNVQRGMIAPLPAAPTGFAPQQSPAQQLPLQAVPRR